MLKKLLSTVLGSVKLWVRNVTGSTRSCVREGLVPTDSKLLGLKSLGSEGSDIPITHPSSVRLQHFQTTSHRMSDVSDRRRLFIATDF